MTDYTNLYVTHEDYKYNELLLETTTNDTKHKNSRAMRKQRAEPPFIICQTGAGVQFRADSVNMRRKKNRDLAAAHLSLAVTFKYISTNKIHLTKIKYYRSSQNDMKIKKEFKRQVSLHHLT